MIELYGYWRSSASYRVRIALNLKELAYENKVVHLVNNGGEHHSEEYARLNAQQLLPTLIDGENVLTQSLAICEYLEEAYPERTRLLPESFLERARVRAFADAIACEIAPLGNLRVLNKVAELGADKGAWSREWMALTFKALETQVRDSAYCVGETVSMAECFLVPQMYNARRWELDLSPYPNLVRIDAQCAELESFVKAHPDNQPDAA